MTRNTNIALALAVALLGTAIEARATTVNTSVAPSRRPGFL